MVTLRTACREAHWKSCEAREAPYWAASPACLAARAALFWGKVMGVGEEEEEEEEEGEAAPPLSLVMVVAEVFDRESPPELQNTSPSPPPPLLLPLARPLRSASKAPLTAATPPFTPSSPSSTSPPRASVTLPASPCTWETRARMRASSKRGESRA
jgi:hypothetical protein